MRPENEKPLCDFIGSILRAETGETIEVVGQLDRERRSTKDVEAL
jgi:hypothetical protein